MQLEEKENTQEEQEELEGNYGYIDTETERFIKHTHLDDWQEWWDDIQFTISCQEAILK